MRVTQPFYDTPEKGAHDEKESVKPAGVRGVWWHETLRVLASIEKYVRHLLAPMNGFANSLESFT